MDDLTIRIRGCGHDHAKGGRGGVAFRVLTWDEQALPGLQWCSMGKVVPDLQVMDGDLVGNRDRPEGLTRLDLMIDLAFGIRCGDFYRQDQLRIFT